LPTSRVFRFQQAVTYPVETHDTPDKLVPRLAKVPDISQREREERRLIEEQTWQEVGGQQAVDMVANSVVHVRETVLQPLPVLLDAAKFLLLYVRMF